MNTNYLYFCDETDRYHVCINVKAYDKILELCSKENSNETGGILIGNYSDDLLTAFITDIIPPPEDSKHFRFSFIRGNKGILKILDRFWEKGKYYLGEWHYHPNASPNPSSTDLCQMKKLSDYSKLKCPEPILLIIGGYQCNWCNSINIITSKSIINLKAIV